MGAPEVQRNTHRRSDMDSRFGFKSMYFRGRLRSSRKLRLAVAVLVDASVLGVGGVVPLATDLRLWRL